MEESATRVGLIKVETRARAHTLTRLLTCAHYVPMSLREGKKKKREKVPPGFQVHRSLLEMCGMCVRLHKSVSLSQTHTIPADVFVHSGEEESAKG